MVRLCAGIAAAAAALRSDCVRAQFSDDVPRARTIPEKQQIDSDMQRSRLRLGPVRLLPSIAVSNAGYDNNVFGTSEDAVSDWTFTIHGGLRLIVPLGPKVYFRGDLLPQYTWYDKLTDRRKFGGIFNASLLGFFNRMSVQLSAYDSKDWAYYSSEIQSRVQTRAEDASAGVEVELARRFSIFGRGEVQRVRYSPDGQPPTFDVEKDNRTDSTARGGLRYRISQQWDVSATFEQTWSDFARIPENSNNQSRAYLLGVHYDRPRFYVDLEGGYREGKARDGSSFPEYTTGTGSIYVSYFAFRWLEVQGYGRRRIVYSLSPFDPYYFENRIGGGLNVEVLSRVLLRGYAEKGPNNYPLAEPVGDQLVQRRDDVRVFGGGLSTLLIPPVVLTGLVTRTTYDSNIPSGDRSITRFTVTVSFSGELSR